jgi:RNA polymerase sigma factor (sigma-70 family)
MGHRDSLLAQLRRVALHATGERRTDGQLLEYFIVERDEVAFEALLRRHGPMVRGVCLRILGNVHDADDAFQAAFLVLVRRAASVRPREAVGNFLYGVACRTALEVRKRRARRRTRETSLDNLPPPANEPGDLGQELRSILDREVSRLADKYRLPVVLCELEGRSRKEVARQLAIPEGTLSSRLATARKRLAARLARYGLAVSAAALTALFAESTAPAGVPTALSIATTKAALLTAAGPAAGLVSTTVLTLTEGVLKAMFIAKLKTATVVLCGVAALGLGTGGVVYQTRAGAADPQSGDRTVQERPRRAIDAGQEKDKWRQIAEEAQAREKKMQAELESLRAELEEWRSRSRSQAAQAEAERRRAEAVLQEARAEAQRRRAESAFQGTRNRAEGARAAAVDPSRQPETARAGSRDHQGQRDANRSPDRQPDLKSIMEKVEAQRAKILEEYGTRLKALKLEQQKLEEQMQKHLAELDQSKARFEQLHRQSFTRPEAESKRSGGDKLDQVLERLERLEKRLDRLEQGRR